MTHRLAFYLLLAFGLAGCSLLIQGKDTGRPCKNGQCPSGQSCDTATNTCQTTKLRGPSCQKDTDCLDANKKYIGRTCVQNKCLANEGVDCTDVSCNPDDNLECLKIKGFSTCYKRCADTHECKTDEKCDGIQGSATLAHCILNECSPDDTGDTQVQLASYLGPCRAINAGDAICVGPLQPAGTGSATVGLCYGNGTVVPGGSCTVGAGYGDTGLCDKGLCVPTKAGSTTGVCVAFCELLDGRSCDPVGGAPTACGWSGLGLAGGCILDAQPPVQAGGACTNTPGVLPCAEDLGCVDLNDGQGMICRQLCNRNTQQQCPNKCVALPNSPNEAILGVCAS